MYKTTVAFQLIRILHRIPSWNSCRPKVLARYGLIRMWDQQFSIASSLGKFRCLFICCQGSNLGTKGKKPETLSDVKVVGALIVIFNLLHGKTTVLMYFLIAEAHE